MQHKTPARAPAQTHYTKLPPTVLEHLVKMKWFLAVIRMWFVLHIVRQSFNKQFVVIVY